MALVVVERVYEQPSSQAQLEESGRKARGCLELRGVKHVSTYLSSDGRRAICVYEAPDAGAVRDANDQAGAAYVRVWTATQW